MNHWNYTQMIKKKPGLAQREKERLAEYLIKKPDYSHLPHDLQEAIGDSS